MYKHKKLLKMSKKARDGLRVSGGHLCVAEATTEPVGETSNPRPPPWQGGAPPLSHSRKSYVHVTRKK